MKSFITTRWLRRAQSVLQYIDFSEFLNQLQEAEETKAGGEYWKRRNLSEYLSVNLPFEKRHSETASFSPQVAPLRVGSNALTMMSEVARENGASVSDLLLATWEALLWRLTGESDVIIGIRHPGRGYEGLENALGLFAKYLPFQGHVADSLTFNELMRKAQGTRARLISGRSILIGNRCAIPTASLSNFHPLS